MIVIEFNSLNTREKDRLGDNQRAFPSGGPELEQEDANVMASSKIKLASACIRLLNDGNLVITGLDIVSEE